MNYEKALIKSMLVVATLFFGSNAVLATNNNVGLVSTPEVEMQAPIVDGPDVRIDTTSTDDGDGTTFMVVRTRWYINGTLIKDELEVIIVKQRK